MEIKKLEKRVEFQTGLDISHQLALQKARNSKFLQDTLGIAPGTPQEKCFSGRGTGCTAYSRSNNFGSSDSAGNPGHITGGAVPLESVTHTQANGYTTKSDIYLGTTCGAVTCTAVNVRVSTTQVGTAPTEGWTGRALVADFSVPASALAGRQDILFSVCGTGSFKGVDYSTLQAMCAPAFGGNDTCDGVSGGGPINTFGQPTMSNPANCQPPVNRTCSGGMNRFGMIAGQADCAPPMTGMPTPAPTPCVSAWNPNVGTVCAGETFTQNDLNGCAVQRNAVGTNGAVCPIVTCTMAGPVRWPDAATGPCGVAAASVTASGGATGSVQNTVPGYIGAFTATCVDGSPGVSNFNMAGATKTCTPIMCSGLPAIAEWSATGMKSTVPGAGLDAVGPWACRGNLAIIQTTTLPANSLATIQAEPAARAAAVNSAATATGGGITLTCMDPGPVTSARSGNLVVGGLSCVPAATPTPTPAPTPTPGPTPYCQYSCIDNFTAGPEGQMNEGELSPDICLHHPMNLAKFSMGCQGFNGVACYLTNPGGGGTQAMCSNGVAPTPVPATPTPAPTAPPVATPIPTPVPTPACHPDGWTTGMWGGAEDDFCTANSSYGPGISTLPHDPPAPTTRCCSGVHSPTYGYGDKVGGGNCYWRCGTSVTSATPSPTAPPAPTQCRQEHPIIWDYFGRSCSEYQLMPGNPTSVTYHNVGDTWTTNSGYSPSGNPVHGTISYRCDLVGGVPQFVVTGQICMDGDFE